VHIIISFCYLLLSRVVKSVYDYQKLFTYIHRIYVYMDCLNHIYHINLYTDFATLLLSSNHKQGAKELIPTYTMSGTKYYNPSLTKQLQQQKACINILHPPQMCQQKCVSCSAGVYYLSHSEYIYCCEMISKLHYCNTKSLLSGSKWNNHLGVVDSMFPWRHGEAAFLDVPSTTHWC
jgi:hypothetical protein